MSVRGLALPLAGARRMAADVSAVSVSQWVANALLTVRELVVAAALSPSLYGVLNLIKVVLNYSQYSHLGVLFAMNKEVPFHRGKGDEANMDRTRHAAFSIAVVTSGAYMLGVCAVFLTRREHYSAIWLYGILAVTGAVFLQQMNDLSKFLLRADKKFTVMSGQSLVYAASELAVVVLLVPRWGIYAVYLAMIMRYLCALVYVQLISPCALRFRRDWATSWRLFRIGLPLMLSGLVLVLLRTLDRVMIGQFLGTTHVGYYSLGSALADVVLALPMAIASVSFPRLLEKFALQERPEDLRAHLVVSTLCIACLMPLVIAPAIFLLPTTVKLLLPRYAPGLTAARNLLLGTFFLSLMTVAANFLITVNRTARLIAHQALGLAAACGLCYLALARGAGINTVSAVVAIGFAVYGIGILIVALVPLLGWRRVLLFCAACAVPALYLFGGVAWLDQEDAGGSIRGALVSCLIFCLAPLILAAWTPSRKLATRVIGFLLTTSGEGGEG